MEEQWASRRGVRAGRTLVVSSTASPPRDFGSHAARRSLPQDFLACSGGRQPFLDQPAAPVHELLPTPLGMT